MVWWDLFLLVAYALIVYWVLLNAIANLAKLATISLNQARLKEELDKRGLAKMVEFGFGFANPYSLSSTLKVLAISVVNTSEYTMYVDWDRSALTDLKGRSRRVIRLTPDKAPDLIQAQVWSVIPAGQVLQEVITAEDVLTRPTTADPFEPNGVIVPIAGAKEDKPLVFYLCIWLIVQRQVPNGDSQPDIQTLIPCEFVIYKSPWTNVLPW
ncbi:MAG: hypothetical protein VKJ64_05065 [Leptolyngbyaceae bacterium]|nr:hypothetical protein [Leptolyngbyaceae bacterium]